MTDAELLAEAMRLKALDRAGWKRVGVVNPESVAAHSWGVALAALLRCVDEIENWSIASRLKLYLSTQLSANTPMALPRS